VWPNG